LGRVAAFDRSFQAFIATQFLGAFNDNLFKQLVLLLAANMLFEGQDVQGYALATFALPFILFSGIAGDISERFSKQRVMVVVKWAEVLIMLVGAVALQLKSWPMLLMALFAMGTHSAFFGPSKYGGIPELVSKQDIIRANGAATMTTFIAVLIGGALGGVLLDEFSDRLWVTGAVCVLFALLGTVTVSQIRRVEAKDPSLRLSLNPFGNMFKTIGMLRRLDGIWGLVLLNSAFFFNAAVVQSAIIGLGAPEYLNIGPGEKRLLAFVQATLSVAVAVGALLAPKIARRVHPGRLAALAALSMFAGQLMFNTVGTVITRADGGLWMMHACAIWVGVSGAAMIVPVTSYLQFAPPEGKRGMTFGVTNFMNFTFIFLAAAHYQVFRLPAVNLSPALAQTASGLFMLALLFYSRAQVRRLQIV
jgi:acyl-[acyl-carrier-protein]-phospholipid O-acyltransferase/long-chain-fatty-acid--[acyl-carrier-protein] ligase